MLGGLTVNGSALITQKLEVNGTFSGYFMQAALDLKANTPDVYNKTTIDNALDAKKLPSVMVAVRFPIRFTSTAE
jgi:hypothetical protein